MGFRANTDGGSVRILWWSASSDFGKLATITVTTPDGASRIVRGFETVTVSEVAVVVDHEAELGRPLTYRSIIDGVTVDQVQVTVTSELPLITDPIRGRHVPVTIQSWPQVQHERAGSVIQIADSPEPVVVDGVESLGTSTITLIHSAGDDSADALQALLASSSVLVIRPTCADLPMRWASARDRTRKRFSRSPGSRWVDVIELVYLGMPWPDMPAQGNTLGDLHAAVPTTLGDIAARFPNLALLAFTDVTL